MRSTDTHCRTCGVEYKNNPIILIVIALLVLGGLFWVGSAFHSKDSVVPVKEDIKLEPEEHLHTNWVMEDDTDKMTDRQRRYATVQYEKNFRNEKEKHEIGDG